MYKLDGNLRNASSATTFHCPLYARVGITGMTNIGTNEPKPKLLIVGKETRAISRRVAVIKKCVKFDLYGER
jgi:hypothetical protein